MRIEIRARASRAPGRRAVQRVRFDAITVDDGRVQSCCRRSRHARARAACPAASPRRAEKRVPRTAAAPSRFDGRARPDDVVVEARDRRCARPPRAGVEQPAQDPHRVGHGAAEIAAVNRAVEAGDLDVDLKGPRSCQVSAGTPVAKL